MPTKRKSSRRKYGPKAQQERRIRFALGLLGAVAGGSGTLAGVIGDVPARALELHGGRGDDLPHLAAAARTGGHLRVGKPLQQLKAVLALLALILVDRQPVGPVSGCLPFDFRCLGAAGQFRLSH